MSALPPVVMEIIANSRKYIDETGKAVKAGDEASQKFIAAAEKDAAAAEAEAKKLSEAADQKVAAADKAAAAAEAAAQKVEAAYARLAAATEAQQAKAAEAVEAATAKQEAALAKLDEALAAQNKAQDASAAKAEEAAARRAAADEAAATKSKSSVETMAKGVGVASGVIATALAVVDVSTTVVAGNFQAQMTKLATSAGEPVENLGLIHDGILRMAQDTGSGPKELADAMYLVSSAGFHGAEGLEVLKAATEGAKAEGADFKTVSDAVTSAMIDYHLKASDSADVTSKLVAATGAGKVSFQDLAGAMPAVLPAASAAHVALDDVLGDLASMTVHGMSAQQAAENVTDTIRHMQNPTAQQAKELALLGMSTNQLADDLSSKGLSGTLQDIQSHIAAMMPPGTEKVITDMKTAMANMAPAAQELAQHLFDGSMTMHDYTKAAQELDPVSAKQAQQFATLLGSTHRIGDEMISGEKVLQTYGGALARATGDATGLKVALMLTGENAGTTKTAIDAVSAAHADAAGNVKGWAEIQQNFNQRVAEAKASFDALVISVGDGLLPILGDLMKTAVDVMKPVIEWVSHNKELVAGILIATTVVFGLVAAVSALVVAFAFLEANPIVLIITGVILAVVALVAAVVWLVQNWSTVTKVITDVWNGFVGWVQDVTNGFVGWWNDLWSGFANWIKAVWQGYVSFVMGIWVGFLNGILNFLHPIIDTIRGIWEGFWGGPFGQLIVSVFNLIRVTIEFVVGWIVVFIRNYLDMTWSIWTTVWNNVSSFFTTIWNGIVSFVTTVWTTIYNAIAGPLNTIWNVITSVLNTIWNIWVNTWNQFTGFVSGIWNTIVSGIQGAVGLVSNAVGGVGQSILDTITGIAGKVFDAGANIVKSIADGITGAIHFVTDAIGSVTQWISDHLPHSPAKTGPLSGRGYPLYSGMAISESLAKGMTDNLGLVTTAAFAVAGSASVTAGGYGLGVAPVLYAGTGGAPVPQNGSTGAPRGSAPAGNGAGTTINNTIYAQTNADSYQIANDLGFVLLGQK